MAYQQMSDLSEAGQGEDVQTCHQLILAVLLEHAQLSTHAICEHVSAVFPLGRLAGGRGERDALQFIEDCLLILEDGGLVRRLPAGYILTPDGEQAAISDSFEHPGDPTVPPPAGATPDPVAEQSLEDILASLRRDMASAGGVGEEPTAPPPIPDEPPSPAHPIEESPVERSEAAKRTQLPDPAPPAPAPVAPPPIETKTGAGISFSKKASLEEQATESEGLAADPGHEPPALGTDETLAPPDPVSDQVDADDMFEPPAPATPERKRAAPARPMLDVSAIRSQIEQLDQLEVNAEPEPADPSPAIAPSAPAAPVQPDAPAPRQASLPGRLVESIKRRMTVDRTEEVEVRIAAEDSDGLTVGLRGDGAPTVHEIPVTSVMSLRLTAPRGGFVIAPHSPESQWVRTDQRAGDQPFAAWRFTITPTRRGKTVLELTLSYKEIGPEGLIADSALPDKTIEIKVRANYGKIARRAASWAITLLLGAALGAYFDELVALVRNLTAV